MGIYEPHEKHTANGQAATDANQLSNLLESGNHEAMTTKLSHCVKSLLDIQNVSSTNSTKQEARYRDAIKQLCLALELNKAYIFAHIESMNGGEAMEPKKNRPDDSIISSLNRLWADKEAYAEFSREYQEGELLDRASSRVRSAMYKNNPDQDYIQRGADAYEVISVCGIATEKSIIELVYQGKSKNEIIASLKKNDKGRHPSP